jgi:hypothetical protein
MAQDARDGRRPAGRDLRDRRAVARHRGSGGAELRFRPSAAARSRRDDAAPRRRPPALRLRRWIARHAVWAAFGVVALGFVVAVSVCDAPRLVELRLPGLTLGLLFVMIIQSGMSSRAKGAK